MTGYFHPSIFCVADNQQDTFTDGYDLDATYLGRFRPEQLTITLLVRLRACAEVIKDSESPSGETVLLTWRGRERRVIRARGEHEGLGMQWKWDAPDAERFRNFILKFEDVPEGLTDRGCIWVDQGDIVPAHFKVYPRKFSPNDSIADLVTQAKRCIQTQLLEAAEFA